MVRERRRGPSCGKLVTINALPTELAAISAWLFRRRGQPDPCRKGWIVLVKSSARVDVHSPGPEVGAIVPAGNNATVATQ